MWNSSKRLGREKNGGIAVLAAGSFTVLGLVAGIAIDFESAYVLQSDLQSATDVAALFAASVPSATEEKMKEEASAAFNANVSRIKDYLDPDITTSVTRDNANYAAYVTVVAKGAMPTAFMKLAHIDSVPVSVKSVARVVDSSLIPCVVALDPSSSESFLVTGNSSVISDGCGIYVNSSSSTALVQQGSGTLKAKSLSVVGDYDKKGVYTPTPQAHQTVASDPLAAIPEPTMPSACTYSNQSFNSTKTFAAGSVFCGSIAFKGDATFSPGVHYFKNATVSTAANINVTGSKIMLYFGPESTLKKAAGTGAFKLSAMDSGTYQGIAIYGSRDSTTIPEFSIVGNKDYNVDGSIYLPKAALEMQGTSDIKMTSGAGSLVSYRFTFKGNSSLTVDSTGNNGPFSQVTRKVTLTQ